MTITSPRRRDTSDASARNATALNLHKMRPDESTTLDGIYRIESILDCVNVVKHNVSEPSAQSMIIQMLLD